MRLLLLLCLLTIAAHAVEQEERDRLREELTRALGELTEVQERVTTAVKDAGIPLPPGVQVTLAARKQTGEDWLKRVKDQTGDFPADEVEGFREGLDGLRGRLDSVTGLVEQSTSANDRWPHCVDLPEFARYRGYLRSRIDQVLLETAAGAEHLGDDEVEWRRQRRHELILQLIESGNQVAERWQLVPKESPALREYQDLRTALRATAEAGLQQSMPTSDHDLDRNEAILWLLDEIVSLVQTREEHRAQREIPADAPLLAAYLAAIAAEEQALRAQIAHRRADMSDESAWNLQEDLLRREREQRNRLSSLAWDGLDLDLGINEQRLQFAESEKGAPIVLRTAISPRLTALDREHGDSVARLVKALSSGSRVEALQAKGAMRILQRDLEVFTEEFAQRLERDEQEKEWRVRSTEPGVAAALAKLDAAWIAMDGARARQVAADHSAIRADLARELSEVEAENAQMAADRSRQEMDRVRETLDLSRQRVVDVLENPQPKPEPDAKF